MRLTLTRAHHARIARAVPLQRMDVAQFVVEASLREANSVIEQAETTRMSARDFARILELLENPPVPNARLKAAIVALPDAL